MVESGQRCELQSPEVHTKNHENRYLSNTLSQDFTIQNILKREPNLGDSLKDNTSSSSPELLRRYRDDVLHIQDHFQQKWFSRKKGSPTNILGIILI